MKEVGAISAASQVRPGQLASVVMVAFLLVGCGRPATEAECIEILERTARLEAQKRLDDPQQVEEQVQLTREKLKSRVHLECVGKRITDSALECVRQAKSSDEIERVCFQWAGVTRR